MGRYSEALVEDTRDFADRFMNSLRGDGRRVLLLCGLCTFEENFCMAICIVHDILWCCCVVVLFPERLGEGRFLGAVSPSSLT